MVKNSRDSGLHFGRQAAFCFLLRLSSSVVDVEQSAGASRSQMPFENEHLHTMNYPHKRTSSRDFCAWGIQTGPFAACGANFVFKFSNFLPSSLWGNKNWLPNMKAEKLEIFLNKIGLTGCKWSSLNAPCTESLVSHFGWENYIF